MATVSVGKTIDLSAIAQGTSINYKVEDSKIATVDSNGVVTGKSVGQTKLTLTATVLMETLKLLIVDWLLQMKRKN